MLPCVSPTLRFLNPLAPRERFRGTVQFQEPERRSILTRYVLACYTRTAHHPMKNKNHNANGHPPMQNHAGEGLGDLMSDFWSWLSNESQGLFGRKDHHVF
jgi:hypothetical protein